jgi:hypothetical protein
MENKYLSSTYEDESAQYREFNQVSYDQVEVNPYVQDDAVYRSISILSMPHNDYFKLSEEAEYVDYSLQRPKFHKQNKTVSQTTSASSSISASLSLKPSEVPDILMSSNFEVNTPLQSAFVRIDNLLHESNGVSYDFSEQNCQV